MRRFGQSSHVSRTVLWADEQTAGQGRLDRHWFSIPGRDITASVCFPSPVDCIDAPKLSLIAGIALVGILREEFGIEALAKWPNDVVTPRGKIAGILSSYLSPSDGVICGIGINVNSRPDEIYFDPIRPCASVRTELGHEVSREGIFAQWLRAFEEIWPLARCSRFCDLQAAFDPISYYRGKRMKVYIGAAPVPDNITNCEVIEGRAMSIDSSGALLIETLNSGEYKVTIQDTLVPIE
jgi:BirA family biotin operon repressor/biotin-[acetyl-CoA-carboxylase] ligase